jgi:hypothetical protein
MAKCSQCGAETQLYVNGVPICPACDNRSESTGSKPPHRESPRESLTIKPRNAT